MTSREQFEKEVRKIHRQHQVLRKRYETAVDWNQIDTDYFAAILAAVDAHVERVIGADEETGAGLRCREHGRIEGSGVTPTDHLRNQLRADQRQRAGLEVKS